MALHRALNNFTAGELSPNLDARIDLAKYDSGCRRLENMRPLPWGGVTMRAGTKFVVKTKYVTLESRLLPFNFSTAVGYMLEFGDRYIRFVKNEAQITAATTFAWITATAYRVGDCVTHSGSNYRCLIAHTSGVFATDLAALKWVLLTGNAPYEIVSPYLAAEVLQIQAREINDVVYLVHPNHQPQKLSRFADTNWTITEIPWKTPAFLDENTETSKVLRLDDTSSIADWVTATAYTVGNLVQYNADTRIFRCIVAHTSGVFLTDLAAGKWEQIHILSSSGFLPFVAGHVGSYWEIRHLRDSSNVHLSLAASGGTVTSGTLKVKGAWTVTTTDRWYGTLLVERLSLDGSRWEVIGSYAAASGRNVSASGTQETEQLFRLTYTATGDPYGSGVWAGTAPTSDVYATATLEVADAYVSGLVRGTEFLDTQHLIVQVITSPESTDETWIWSEGAWSTYRGFPRAVGLYEQRLLFGGITYKPNTTWGSKAADFENFQYSDDDDGAVAYQFAACQQNPIQWLESLNRIQAGTSGEECSLGSGNTDEPLTPANVTVRTPSNNGSEYIQPLKVGSKVLFVRRQGTRILELAEANQFATPGDQPCIDLTLLAEHIGAEGIKQLGFAQLPDPLVYAVLNSGRMGVMTYNKEQNINAWARYLTDGNFKSVGILYGTPTDTVYVIVERFGTVAVERFIEVFTTENPDKIQACYGMDSAVLYEGIGINTLNGLGHLEGQIVAVTADGNVVGDAFTHVGALTVQNGQITLPLDQYPTGAAVIRAGLRYTGQILPMKVDSNLSNGTSQGRNRRISEVCFRFRDTLGGVWGNSSVNRPELGQWSEEIPFRDTNDRMDSSPPLFTGDVPRPSAAGTGLSCDFGIQQIQPLPFTLLGIFAKMEFFGD